MLTKGEETIRAVDPMHSLAGVGGIERESDGGAEDGSTGESKAGLRSEEELASALEREEKGRKEWARERGENRKGKVVTWMPAKKMVRESCPDRCMKEPP